jgi:hypothetical protein
VNSGRELERLVQEIERCLLPSGFDVVVNQTAFNAEGDQIAEFDIVISGRLGSSQVKWLIECRDRPSRGPAPGSWIEQLVTRKMRFNFDKVIAVSTTGFASGAIDLAETSGISLRSVERITDIATDFNIQEIQYYAHQVTIGPTEMGVTNPALVGVDIVRDAQIKLACETAYQTFPNFVSQNFDLDRATLSGDACFRFLFDCEYPLDVVIGDRHLRIDGLSLPIQLDIFVYEGKMLTANVYSDKNEMKGRDVTFVFDLPTGSFTQRVLFLNNFDGTQDMRLFPPENVPAGYTLDFLQLFVADGM